MGRRFKPRHAIALAVVALSVIATPFAIIHANNFRGGWAIGGEVLVIPLGLLIAWVVCTVAKEAEEARNKKEQEDGFQ